MKLVKIGFSPVMLHVESLMKLCLVILDKIEKLHYFLATLRRMAEPLVSVQYVDISQSYHKSMLSVLGFCL